VEGEWRGTAVARVIEVDGRFSTGGLQEASRASEITHWKARGIISNMSLKRLRRLSVGQLRLL